jgi:hypothetical protein
MTAAATYARATAGYDERHEHELAAAILEAIAKTSVLADCNVMALRTGEAASALVSVLATILAMSPSATRSPTAIRKTCDELHGRLRRRVAAGENCKEMQHFLERVFRGLDTEGNA